MRFGGLVAAAGASSRMGLPKALLPHRDGAPFAAFLSRTFLEAGLAPVLLTVPEGSLGVEVASAVLDLRVLVTPNQLPDLGLLGSVRTALSLCGDVDGIVISPVDCPFSSPALVRSLVEALGPHPAAVPVADGVRGHPIAFGRAALPALRGEVAHDIASMRELLWVLGPGVVEVPWADARVAEDIDRLEDFERHFGPWRGPGLPGRREGGS